MIPEPTWTTTMLLMLISIAVERRFELTVEIEKWVLRKLASRARKNSRRVGTGLKDSVLEHVQQESTERITKSNSRLIETKEKTKQKLGDKKTIKRTKRSG